MYASNPIFDVLRNTKFEEVEPAGLGSLDPSEGGSSCENSFVFTDCTGPSREPWEEAVDRFRGAGFLGNNAISEYAKCLQRNPSFILADRFIQERKMTESESREYILKKMNEAKKGNQLLFIPIILEKGFRNKADHVVTLIYDSSITSDIKGGVLNKSWEYYDSQGKDIANEKRKMKGVGVAPVELFGESIESNTIAHQNLLDGVNCAAFVCRFMSERLVKPFAKICTKQSIDIKKKRQEMASQIELFNGKKIRQVVAVKEESSGFFDFISRLFEFFLSFFLCFSEPLR